MRRLTFIICFLGVSAVMSAEPPQSFLLKSVTVSGNVTISETEFLSALPLKVGEPVELERLPLAREVVQSHLRNTGHLTATVASSYRVSSASIHVDYLVSEGPLFRFGRTEVDGLETVPVYVAERELTYKQGDPYNRQQLFRTQTRLYQTGLFEDVRIQASTTTANNAEITIRLKQKPLKWIKGGVGWGSEEKERFTLILTHENLGRRAYRAEALATISRIWLEYRLDFVNRYFLGTRTEQRTSLSWRNEDRDGYDYERVLGEWSLGRQLGRVVHGSLGFQIKRNVVFNLDREIALTTADRSDSRAVILSLNRETANDFFYPTNGSRTNLTLQRTGGELFGGNLDFNRATLDYRLYEKIWKQLIAAVAFRTGVVEEFSPSTEVPIFERFFMGGANSVRGYRERGVGPTDIEGSPLGGNYRLGSTVEFRFPLFWKLSGALFVDGGQVGPTFNAARPANWKYGGGGGLRFLTPVGPIRADYGYKLNRDEDDVDPWRIHLSLGEAF